jgi:hypothetical protein
MGDDVLVDQPAERTTRLTFNRPPRLNAPTLTPVRWQNR